jgi:hypothetical protein
MGQAQAKSPPPPPPPTYVLVPPAFDTQRRSDATSKLCMLPMEYLFGRAAREKLFDSHVSSSQGVTASLTMSPDDSDDVSVLLRAFAPVADASARAANVSATFRYDADVDVGPREAAAFAEIDARTAGRIAARAAVHDFAVRGAP